MVRIGFNEFYHSNTALENNRFGDASEVVTVVTVMTVVAVVTVVTIVQGTICFHCASRFSQSNVKTRRGGLR